jgi:hypothetical protein
MTDAFPGTTSEAVLGFHVADRMKSELLVASRLLQTLMQMQGPEADGARRLFLEYIQALSQDMALTQAVIHESEMIRINTVFLGLQGMIAEGQLQDIQSHLTWMISIMTTYAQRAMEFLKKVNVL